MTWKEIISIIINAIIALIGGMAFYIGTTMVVDELYRLNETIMIGISLMFVGVILILVFTRFDSKK